MTFEDVEQDLLSHDVQMKEYFSSDFKNLLYGILEKDTRKRLTLEQIMQHPFFKRLDWAKVEKKKLKPPFKPKALNALKISKADQMVMQDELQTSPSNADYSRSESRAISLKKKFR